MVLGVVWLFLGFKMRASEWFLYDLRWVGQLFLALAI